MAARATGHHHWPGAPFDLSPEGFYDVVGVGNKRPIIVNCVTADADLVMEAQRTSLVRPLRKMLLTLCEVAGVVAPMYMWEQWQLRCKLHKVLIPAAVQGGRGAGGPLTVSGKFLPCAGLMDDRCITNLVRRCCNPAVAAAIVTQLGRVAADAAAVLAVMAREEGGA